MTFEEFCNTVFAQRQIEDAKKHGCIKLAPDRFEEALLLLYKYWIEFPDNWTCGKGSLIADMDICSAFNWDCAEEKQQLQIETYYHLYEWINCGHELKEYVNGQWQDAKTA